MKNTGIEVLYDVMLLETKQYDRMDIVINLVTMVMHQQHRHIHCIFVAVAIVKLPLLYFKPD